MGEVFAVRPLGPQQSTTFQGEVARVARVLPPAARRRLSHEGAPVLDSEGFLKLLADDGYVVALIAEARSRGVEVVISALIINEAVHTHTNKSRLDWVLSGLRVVPVGD
ncbi:hypothetical protein GCM10022284_02750 [Streptomyces hundungensis]